MTRHLAVHGFSVPLTGEWDVLINRGDRKRGHMVISGRREPRYNLTWDRRSRQPDFERTLRKMSKQMFRQTRAVVTHMEAAGNDGCLAAYDGPDGRYHALAFQPDPDNSLSLVIRQLQPGSMDELRAMARHTKVAQPGDLVPWRLHAIDIDLPEAWRLEGIQQYSGLVRGLWLRSVGGKLHKHDQVLVMRRFACASRVLADQSIAGWIGTRLRRKEALVDSRDHGDGLWSGTCTAPGDSWWRRFRGISETRHLHAWIEPEWDRLVIQEWHGVGDPLPPLRTHRDLNAVTSEVHAA